MLRAVDDGVQGGGERGRWSSCGGVDMRSQHGYLIIKQPVSSLNELLLSSVHH